jgi:polyisoprenoid-binding protein YceI
MVSATIDVPSIDTGVGARDAHLRSADFFDAANFPEITFASRRIIGFNGRYDIPGAITIKGITRDISLAGRTLPPEPGDGDRTVRLAADGVINRTDFGVRAPAGIEGFGLTVARHVKLSLLIVAIAEERLVPGARP